MDAVVASGTNVEAAGGDVERVLVITPAAAEASPGTVDAAIEAGLRRERTALEEAGLVVNVIRAEPEARTAMREQLYQIVDAAAAVNAGRHAGRVVAGTMLAGVGGIQ